MGTHEERQAALRGPYRTRARYTVRMNDLVDPDRCPWDAFRRLETFCKMAVRELTPYEGGRGCRELLSGHWSVINLSEIDPIVGAGWRDEVNRRFRYALLLQTANPFVVRWREENRYRLGEKATFVGPTVDPADKDESVPCAAEMERRVTDLLGKSHMGLAWSLNESHPGATWLWGVRLRFRRPGVVLTANYSYREEPSTWEHVLATWHPRGPLLCAIDRAGVELARLLDPAAEPPAVQPWGRPAKPAPNREGVAV